MSHKAHFDSRYKEFELFLEMPKAVKESKRITQRKVTTEDIKTVLSAIEEGRENREFTTRQYQNCKALVLFHAYTGQRPIATIRKLTVGQFRAALRRDPPVLDVLPQQDKIRMQHYVPLHPCVVATVTPLLNGRNRKDDTCIFAHEYFDKWARRKKFFNPWWTFCLRRSQEICRTIRRRYSVGSVKPCVYHDAWSKRY